MTLPNPRAQFCIVSGQPIPNLAAALDARLRPERVVLFVSREMQTQAQRLQKVLQRHGLYVHRYDLVNRLDLRQVSADVKTCLAECGGDAMLNATGGQKPMSVAACRVFMEHGLPVFYVETDNTLTWLNPSHEPGFALATRITLIDYLESYGYRIVPAGTPPFRHDALTQELLAMVADDGSLLGMVNRIAAASRESLSCTLSPGDRRHPGLKKLLKRFQSAGVLESDVAAGSIRFADEARRFFANGGWLEAHIYGILEAHRRQWGIDDLAVNVQVCSDTPGIVRNELDVLFLCNNRLYLIECKTKLPKGGTDDADELTQMLYKLDSIRKVGGLVIQPMLVSWHAAKPHHDERARLSDIRLVSGRFLTRLPEVLRMWLAAHPQPR